MSLNDLLLLLAPGLLIGAWSVLFTSELFQDRHIFGFIGRWAKMEDTFGRYRLLGRLAFKYTSCHVCLSGGLSVAFGLGALWATYNPLFLIVTPVVAMTFAQLLRRYVW